MEKDSSSSSRRALQRRATLRLLEWGFQPTTIAAELGRTTRWVRSVEEADLASELEKDRSQSSDLPTGLLTGGSPS